MIKSFLLISYRNIRANKGASLLNILCLALAMGTCLFIFNYVFYELSYESNHEKARNLYRVETHTLVNQDLSEKNAYTPSRLGSEVTVSFEEIESSTTLFPYS